MLRRASWATPHRLAGVAQPQGVLDVVRVLGAHPGVGQGLVETGQFDLVADPAGEHRAPEVAGGDLPAGGDRVPGAGAVRVEHGDDRHRGGELVALDRRPEVGPIDTGAGGRRGRRRFAGERRHRIWMPLDGQAPLPRTVADDVVTVDRPQRGGVDRHRVARHVDMTDHHGAGLADAIDDSRRGAAERADRQLEIQRWIGHRLAGDDLAGVGTRQRDGDELQRPVRGCVEPIDDGTGRGDDELRGDIERNRRHAAVTADEVGGRRRFLDEDHPAIGENRDLGHVRADLQLGVDRDVDDGVGHEVEGRRKVGVADGDRRARGSRQGCGTRRPCSPGAATAAMATANPKRSQLGRSRRRQCGRIIPRGSGWFGAGGVLPAYSIRAPRRSICFRRGRRGRFVSAGCACSRRFV